MPTTVYTSAELFDLPEGAVIRTLATHRVGEVRKPHVSTLASWEFEEDGTRILSRRIAWAGDDRDTYEHYHDEVAAYLPAEVIYEPTP
jgi:hypothetical protein